MRIITVFAVLMSMAFWPIGARAQDEFTVTVLLPDAFQVSGEDTGRLLESISAAVESHPDFRLNEIPPQTLSELLLAVGCTTPDPDCLDVVNEILESDFLIWGELGATERAFLVEMTLWDFQAREAVRRFTKAVESDLDEFRQLIPLFGRGIVWGDVGRVQIFVDPPDAELLFDSRPVGQERPIWVEHIELGTHVIRATADGYFDHSETIFVDIDAETVEIELVPTQREVEVTGGRVWTWVALGSGLALTGAGITFGLLSQSTQDSFDSAAGGLSLDLNEVQDLQDQGELEATLSNVFFIAGGLSLIAGIVLFFLEEEEQPRVDSGDRGADVSIAPQVGEGGYGLAVDIGF